MNNFESEPIVNDIMNGIESIAKDIRERQDSIIAMEFTRIIATMLKENGVNVELATIQTPIEQDGSRMLTQYGVYFKRIDFTEHDKKMIDRIKNNETDKCNMTSCRHNIDGKCENKDERKECVEILIKVLCLEEE